MHVNHICNGSLKLTNPRLLNFDKLMKMELFPDDEAVMDFLGVCDNLPSFHHKKWRPYCLNTYGYFGDNTTYENMYDENLPLEDSMKSNLLVTKTIDVQMDTEDSEKTN